jgi:hypothetical protein
VIALFTGLIALDLVLLIGLIPWWSGWLGRGAVADLTVACFFLGVGVSAALSYLLWRWALSGNGDPVSRLGKFLCAVGGTLAVALAVFIVFLAACKALGGAP